ASAAKAPLTIAEEGDEPLVDLFGQVMLQPVRRLIEANDAQVLHPAGDVGKSRAEIRIAQAPEHERRHRDRLWVAIEIARVAKRGPVEVERSGEAGGDAERLFVFGDLVVRERPPRLAAPQALEHRKIAGAQQPFGQARNLEDEDVPRPQPLAGPAM